jgi:hypothetical protein
MEGRRWAMLPHLSVLLGLALFEKMYRSRLEFGNNYVSKDPNSTKVYATCMAPRPVVVG